jgi:hypothetical protein
MVIIIKLSIIILCFLMVYPIFSSKEWKLQLPITGNVNDFLISSKLLEISVTVKSKILSGKDRILPIELNLLTDFDLKTYNTY